MPANGKNAKRPGVHFVCCGGPKIGLGHVYRCIHLANALRARGVATHLFVNPDHRVAGLVASHRLRHSIVPIGKVSALAGNEHNPVCVLDCNRFSRSFLRAIRKRAIVVNLAVQSWPKWYADININRTAVIDVNATRPADANKNTLNLQGPRYTIISERFRAVRQRRVRKQVRTVLICLSAGSYATAVNKVIRAFELVPGPLHMRVILGRGLDDARGVRQCARRSRHDVAVYHDVSDIADKMRDADLAVTFPGLTAYECLCVGVPTVLIAPTLFHLSIARELHDLGCAVNAGLLSKLRTRQLGSRLAALVADATTRAELHRRAKRTVDGKGLNRAVGVILKALKNGRARKGNTE